MIIEKIRSSSLAEIIGAITTILFVIGASYKYGFYSSEIINAKWLVQLFSPTDLLFANLEIATLYLTSMIFLDHLFTRNRSAKETLIYGNTTLIALGLLVYFKTDSYQIILAVVFGFNAMILVLKAKYIGKLCGVVTLLFFIPYELGANDLKKAIASNNLPKVYIDNEVKEWRLLEAFSDKAILMNNNRFKIVEIKDIKFIDNTAN